MRLVANKIFPNPLLTGNVEEFATARLRLLVDQGGSGKRAREETAEHGTSAAKKARTDDAEAVGERPHANGDGKPEDPEKRAEERQAPEKGVDDEGSGFSHLIATGGCL